MSSPTQRAIEALEQKLKQARDYAFGWLDTLQGHEKEKAACGRYIADLLNQIDALRSLPSSTGVPDEDGRSGELLGHITFDREAGELDFHPLSPSKEPETHIGKLVEEDPEQARKNWLRDMTKGAQRPDNIDFCTVRDAGGDEDAEIHIEVRFKDGQKYAPIVIDEGHDDLAMAIAAFLNGNATIPAPKEPASSPEGAEGPTPQT